MKQIAKLYRRTIQPHVVKWLTAVRYNMPTASISMPKRWHSICSVVGRPHSAFNDICNATYAPISKSANETIIARPLDGKKAASIAWNSNELHSKFRWNSFGRHLNWYRVMCWLCLRLHSLHLFSFPSDEQWASAKRYSICPTVSIDDYERLIFPLAMANSMRRNVFAAFSAQLDSDSGRGN